VNILAVFAGMEFKVFGVEFHSVPIMTVRQPSILE
jgi:hypothetical protein